MMNFSTMLFGSWVKMSFQNLFHSCLRKSQPLVSVQFKELLSWCRAPHVWLKHLYFGQTEVSYLGLIPHLYLSRRVYKATENSCQQYCFFANFQEWTADLCFSPSHISADENLGRTGLESWHTASQRLLIFGLR